MKLTEKITAVMVMTFIMVISSAVIFSGGLAEDISGIGKKDIFSGSAGDKLTESVADNLPFVKQWRSFGAETGSKTGEPVVNDVYISEERLLDVSERSLSSAVNFAEAVNSFDKSYSGTLYFAAIPTSTGIYGDNLPSYLSSVTEKQLTDRLYDEIDGNIRKIDAYTILKMLSENYICCRSDTKWTSYGAYCVYRTVIQKLGFIPISYDKYTIRHVTDNYHGNLYSRTGYMESKADILDIYEYNDGTEIIECVGTDFDGVIRDINLYDIDAVESGNPYNLYLGEPMAFIKIRTTVNNEKSLLVIGDETADCFIPFLTKHYSEIAFISADRCGENIKEYVDTDLYEQAVFLVGLDYITEKY